VREVLDALAQGKSNLPESGSGADVFRKVAAHRVTATHAVAGAALEAVTAPQAFDAQTVPGFDVTLSGHLEETDLGLRRIEGMARARQRRLGVTEELTFAATSRPGGLFEAIVGGRRIALAELGDEARGVLVMGALPALLSEVHVPSVARLVVEAAREVPPDGDTPGGVARRSMLARVVLVLLGDGQEGTTAAPNAEALRLAGALFELLALPAMAPERRAIEERVWALVAHGRPHAALRALADKVGFVRDSKSPADDAAS
jgi:hypothetical protein